MKKTTRTFVSDYGELYGFLLTDEEVDAMTREELLEAIKNYGGILIMRHQNGNFCLFDPEDSNGYKCVDVEPGAEIPCDNEEAA